MKLNYLFMAKKTKTTRIKLKSTTTKKATTSSLKRTGKMKPMMAALLVSYNQTSVIRKILDVAGKYNVKTNAVGIRKKTLYDNLSYTDQLLDNLQIELDRYVKSIDNAASISGDDLGDCDTVQDVIDLVEKQLKIQ